MKKRICIVYSILAFVFCSVFFLYYEKDDVHSIVYSSVYYVFLYTPLYLFLISKGLEDYFRSVMILRFKSGRRNAVHYMKKMILHTVFFSLCFFLCMILLDMSKKGIPSLLELKFSVAMLFLQICGWTVIGFAQYLCYLFSKNLSISMMVIWFICGIMGLSESVLFRLKQYIYNIFLTMMILDQEIITKEIIRKMFQNIGIAIGIGFVIIWYQKKMDIIEGRK